PINLAAALQLAVANNLDIAQARAVVAQAQAALFRARVSALPAINLGATYVEHEGQIQRTEGDIITVNRDSLFVGGGPSLTFQTADILFGPVIARDLARATQSGSQRISNEVLLAVADAYFSILRARRRLARVDATLEFLTSEQNSPRRGGAK